MQAVILAGGLATRMRPLTEKIPKSMLEVAERPFIDWQLEKLVQCGFNRVVLCVAYLGELIRNHVQDGSQFNLQVDYSDEGTELLGTAGALRKALPLLESTFLVTYGDSYLPFDYAAPLHMLQMHEDCDAVMSVYKNENQFDASNVVTDGEWVLRYEKGVREPAFNCIDYGAIALRRNVLETIPESTPIGLDRIQSQLAQRRRMRAYVATQRFFEIGSLSGLEELSIFLKNENY